MRRPLGSILPILATCALLPVGLLIAFGHAMVMPPMWVHFYAVGVTALVCTAAAVAITVAGARRGDARTVIVGGGFSLMAALLAVHGLATPGMLVGNNGLIKLTGAATLPVGGAVMALSALPLFASPRAIPRVIVVQSVLACAIVVLSIVGVLKPSLVPGVPSPRSAPAIALFAFGLGVYGALALRAMNTFLLTRRGADFAIVIGIVLLACSLYGALLLTFVDLGWWLGHIFEFVGIVVVGGSLVYDLRRGRDSRALVGNLRAAEVVTSEEAYLGARVRALMVRLAAKDASTEEHTRRVAALAVELGEQLGLSPTRLRSLAIGGLLHDIGKLSVATPILQKPGPLDDDEFSAVKVHPERGRELLSELGGFDDAVKRLVLDHHERLDGTGYPRGLRSDDLDLPTRILAVCDVYDALVSARVYRPAWTRDEALELLRGEADVGFDSRCVKALEDVLAGRTAVAERTLEPAGRLVATPAR
jgi:HD-GYP domain-containing protein (c-di-GMP phosphodiesterase class II)